jgi:DNA polymerase III sliding clamp (beta) subunit (PCNA family)
VQAKKFVEIVRSLVAERDHADLDEASARPLDAAKPKFRIHGLRGGRLPDPAAGRGRGAGGGLALPRFRRMIGKVIFAVSSEESRFQLSARSSACKETRSSSWPPTAIAWRSSS